MTDGFQPGGPTPIGAIFGGAPPAGGGSQPDWSRNAGGGSRSNESSNAQRRPRASLAANLGFLGGAGLAGGFVALVAQLVKSRQQLVAGIIGAVMLAVGLILGRVLHERPRTAATVLVSLGATVLLAAVVLHGSNRWLPVILLAVVAAAHLVLWAGPLRDRPWLFAVGVLAFQVAIVTAVGIATAKNASDDFSGDSGMNFGPVDLGTTQKAPAVTSAVIGVIMLLVARQLAKGGKQGIATPLLLGGALGGIAGAAVIANEGGAWVPIITTLVSGVVLLLIGSELGRRGTSWAGTALTGAGLVAAVLQVIKDNTKGAAVAVLVLGVILLGLAAATANVNPSAPEADAG